MKSKSLIYILAVLAVGCGGSNATNSTTASPFEGSYSGTWQSGGASGPEAMNIDRSGNITGTAGEETIAGKIQNNGDLTFTETGSGGTYNCTGTASLNAQGDLVGQDTYTGTSSGSETFDLAPQ